MPEASAHRALRDRKRALLSASAARREAWATDWQQISPSLLRLDAGLRTAQQLTRSPLAMAGASLALTLFLRRPVRNSGRLVRVGLIGWRLARLALTLYRSAR
jgi:hypothetical protein